MGGVDLMDQLKLAYQLDRRLKFRFYLRFNHCPSKRTKAQRPGPTPPLHLPIFLETRRRCTVCSQAGKENRIFVTCSLCDVALCLQKERSCFYNTIHKPAVTHILKTLLEHDFDDVKILLI